MDPPGDIEADTMEWTGETASAASASLFGNKLATEKRSGRQVPCRYGRGCTHMGEALHTSRFWHPPAPETVPRLQGPSTVGYVCNECGAAFAQVRELQLHMKRKTAWSNQGLVGCRVSCLVDNREWQEGVVSQFGKTGKHCIDFRHSGERRWLAMAKTAFYIVERAPPTAAQECKEAEHDPTEGLAPLERWHVCEDLSIDFCAAQSLLHLAFGCKIQETGHKTVGHLCVTERDRSAAREARGSLLYGELLPRGVNKAMGPTHLNAALARTVFDLGMGTGKVAMQVFLQFANLRRVYGVELSQARFCIGERAVLALMELQPGVYRLEHHKPGRRICISAPPAGPKLPRRLLDMECGNLFDVPDMASADIALLETDMPPDCYPELAGFLRGMREGAQALTYLDLRKMWDAHPFHFRQVEVNRTVADRFPTSWSVHRGHHFFLWNKAFGPPTSPAITPRNGTPTAAAAAAAAAAEAGTAAAAAVTAAAAAAAAGPAAGSGAVGGPPAAPAATAAAAGAAPVPISILRPETPRLKGAGAAQAAPAFPPPSGGRKAQEGKPENSVCFGGLLKFLGFKKRGGSSKRLKQPQQQPANSFHDEGEDMPFPAGAGARAETETEGRRRAPSHGLRHQHQHSA